MPFQFGFDSTNQILGCWFSGQITDADFTRFSLLVCRYIALTLPRGGLTDTTAVTSWEVTAGTLDMIANRPPGVPPVGRHRVIVAPSDEIFEMLGTFARKAEITRPKLHVVRTIDEARAILDVQQFHFGPIQEAELG
jgi:hypothetical protein